MTDKQWNDNKIEDLLSSMPDIQDKRSKSEVFARIEQDSRLSLPRRKKSGRWIPAFVAVAALLVLSLLLPSMLRGNEGAMEMNKVSGSPEGSGKAEMSANAKMAEDSEEVTESDSASDSAMRDTKQSISLFASEDYVVFHSAVYPEDTVGSTVFHFGLAGEAAASVPITFIIPDSQIEEDFGNLDPTSFDLYEKYASRIDEEALGFYEYHPYLGKLSVDGDAIVHTLPKGHGYDTASGTITTFGGTLKDTFYGFREIRFENEDGTPVEFDQVGKPSEPMQLTNGINFYNYYLFKQGNEQDFLTPNFSKSYSTLEEALQDMKVKPNDVYNPLIPKNINFDVIDEKGLTVVRFNEPLDLEAMLPKEAMQMIEGMLLTAASFDRQLQFENILQTKWNGFDFSQSVPIPVGPNVMPFLLK